MIPAIYFDFYDGSTYIWSDGILGDTAVSKFNSFDNSGNITIQGI
jgi:acyl CoA:acetate/3-ketoacid CoA transferase alpha subunit